MVIPTNLNRQQLLGGTSHTVQLELFLAELFGHFQPQRTQGKEGQEADVPNLRSSTPSPTGKEELEGGGERNRP